MQINQLETHTLDLDIIRDFKMFLELLTNYLFKYKKQSLKSSTLNVKSTLKGIRQNNNFFLREEKPDLGECIKPGGEIRKMELFRHILKQSEDTVETLKVLGIQSGYNRGVVLAGDEI